eukprot:1019723-Lingulodinium_polyedra.AAC.1
MLQGNITKSIPTTRFYTFACTTRECQRDNTRKSTQLKMPSLNYERIDANSAISPSRYQHINVNNPAAAA